MAVLDPAPTPGIDPETYDRISRLVYAHTGVRLGPGKEYFVEGRLGGLLAELGCSGWAELPDRLVAARRRGADALIRAVVTHETRFFRDGVPFRALAEKVAPEQDRAVRAEGGRLRVWCAGCSTGQEPYSVVMALWDRIGRSGLDLEVWATDISDRALDKARTARYEAQDVERAVPPRGVQRWFERQADGRLRVCSPVRDRVRFARLNVLRDPAPEGRFHVVLCRNVGIYFDRPARKHLYRVLGRVLIPGGYLLLGAAETLFPPVPWFKTCYFDRTLLFRRTPGAVP